jgi:hypothetical protein
MSTIRPPFPDHVRRPVRRVHATWRLLALGVVVAAGTILPTVWTVRAVEVDSSRQLPDAARKNLELLVGEPVILVSPGWIRDRMGAWPGVSSVEVRRDLDGTLVLREKVCSPAGSIAGGSGWHAVCPDGWIGERLDGPVQPVLEGLTPEPAVLHRALIAAGRLRLAGIGTPVRLRAVLPGELEVWLGEGEASARVLLAVSGSPAEKQLSSLLGGSPMPPGSFADVSGEDRVVLDLGDEGAVGS